MQEIVFRVGKLHPAIFRCYFCGHNDRQDLKKKWLNGEFQMLLESNLFLLIYTYTQSCIRSVAHCRQAGSGMKSGGLLRAFSYSAATDVAT